MTSADIARFFDSAGYMKLPGLLPDELLSQMQKVVAAGLEDRVTPFRMNSAGEACRLDSLLERDGVFLDALRTPFVLDALIAILGPNVEVTRHRHNHATRNAPGDIPFRLHRDIQQWSRPLISVFFYFEAATVDNGCTTVVPASHRIPYAGPQSGGGGGNWADEHDEYRHLIGQELPLEMPRGGVLLLNSLCFHSVGAARRSGGSRLSAVFACRSIDEIASEGGDDSVLLCGSRRFVGNKALEVSGSLRRGDN
ncbi:phytanoyl-CoA dioxygenase family protein [Arthrobacter sp. HS15c]|uniref:phytanoyl-CoA dioxygenase family protein n=1 Tax=Arthrobacter sp. HS15c TaxID=3230279 RepID=UPI003467C7C0